MQINTISPKKWKVTAPPSKSYTNRALLVAALAKGKSILLNPLFCDDSKYMIKALEQFGINFEQSEDKIIVYGRDGYLGDPAKKIFVGNAGTTFRFLTTACAISNSIAVVLDGDKRMRQRPIADLVEALEKLGAVIGTSDGFPPLTIWGHSFIGGKTSIRGKLSSQYISSILLSSPYGRKDVEVSVKDKIASKPYIDITLDIMSSFGVKVQNKDYRKYKIKTGQRYKGRTYQIEGDASNASYFFAAAAITGGEIEVFNLPINSVQGDLKLVAVLEKMGCSIKRKKNSIVLKGNPLKGIDIDMNEMPDVVPTLAIVACFAKGKTSISNVENLRIKESDRIRAVCNELTRIGGDVTERKDGLTINPRELNGAEIETYNDHRIAMSFAIAGLKVNGITIKNPNCVKKSFPDYWKIFNELFINNI
jgi:3-phosphoshikimate 1-carboxyvinyltransferase